MLNFIKSILRPIKAKYIYYTNYIKLYRISGRVRKNYLNSTDNISNESNGEKKYLIMSGIGMDKVGVFCDIQGFIRWIALCEHTGEYIPVIDMKYVPNSLLENKDIGKSNGWENFFSQVSQSSIEEAHCSRKKIIVNMLDNPPFFKKEYRDLMHQFYGENWIKDKAKRVKWQEIWNKYFRMTDELCKYIDDWWDANTSKDDKVLGVRMRGSDYVQIKPHGHSVQPDFMQVSSKIDEVIEQYGCNKIYIATEDESLIRQFKQLYGERAIFMDGTRIEVRDNEIALDAFERMKVSKYQQGMEYIATIALLARCDCLISSISNATPYIYLMKNGDFEYDYVFELGEYE